MSYIKDNVSRQILINPSVIILIGLIAGIIPFAIVPSITAYYAIIITFIILMIISFMMDMRNFLKTTMIAIIGFLLSLNARNPGKNHYDSILPDRNCGAILIAEVIDTTCPTSKDLDWMAHPYMIKVKVEKFKFSTHDEWRITHGKTAVILPKEGPKVGYGDKVIMTGAFIQPMEPVFKGDFDFRRYLLSKGLRRIFEASSCEIMENPSSYNFYHNILEFRDFLMNRSVQGMKDVENRKITSAIFFGCRQGLDPEEKRNFIRSGTIHVFSISGLHVGIIAVILFWMLRWLPFRIRHLLIPGIIFLYVFTTGMTPPAVRAFLMIGIWCLQRSFLYSSSPLNSVFLSASIILIYNPFSIMDIGFQFSFTVAGFLVLSWNNSKTWISSVIEKTLWTPVYGGFTYSTFKTRIVVFMTRAILASFIAWMAGTGLCLFYQGLFIPASIMINFAIIPFVSIFFAAVILKVILSMIFLHSDLIGNFAEWTLYIIRKISESGADMGNFCITRPSNILILALYIFIIVFVFNPGKKYFFMSFAGIISILSVWFFNSHTGGGAIYVIHGGSSQEPVIAICPPGNTRIFLINSGSNETARSMINMLTMKGVDFIDTMLICEARRDFCEAAPRIIMAKNIRNMIITDKYKRSWFSKRAVETAIYSGCATTVFQDREGVAYDKSGISFSKAYNGRAINYKVKYCIPETILDIEIIDIGYGLQKICIKSSKKSNAVVEYISTNKPELVEIKL